jgi:hypothetical protein
MSATGYQRALADLMRDIGLCAALRHGAAGLDGYDLTEAERARLAAIARHRGMGVTCMLYRASRLVGITRRRPDLVQALGSEFRPAFDAYLLACPDADPDFDREAAAFARFVAGRDTTPDRRRA